MRKLTLTRKQYRPDGIFSDLCREDGTLLAQTLEHAYGQGGTSTDPSPVEYFPKIPKGVYTCNKGSHRLHGMTATFLTFEVESVPNCVGILFHWGNYNADSEGCVLLGNSIILEQDGKTQMISNSRQAFARFMAELAGQDSFELTVA